MVFYKDLADSVESILDNKYKALGAFSVSTKGKTPSGLKLELKGKRKNGSDNVTGGFKWSNTCKCDSYDVDNTGDISGEGILNEKFVVKGVAEGLTFNFKTLINLNADNDKEANACAEKEAKTSRNTVGGGLTYVNDKVAADFQVTKKRFNVPSVALSVAGEVTDNLTLGVNIKAPLQAPAKDVKAKIVDTDFTAKASFEDLDVVVGVENCGQELSLGLVHKFCNKLTVGGRITKSQNKTFPWCYSKPAQEESTTEDAPANDSKWGFTLGFQCKNDDNATLSAKLNEKAVLTTSYDLELRQNLRANIVTETNVKNISGGTKLGLGLSFSK